MAADGQVSGDVAFCISGGGARDVILSEFEIAPSRGAYFTSSAWLILESTTAAMAKIDRSFAQLVTLQKTNWRKPPKQTVRPRHEALLIREAFRELERNGDGIDELRKQLRAAEKLAAQLQSSLSRGKKDQATRLLSQLKASCVKCHRQHRDG